MIEWQAWGWAGSVSLSIVAAFVTRQRWPGRFAALTVPHIVAVTILAVGAWEAATSLPGMLLGIPFAVPSTNENQVTLYAASYVAYVAAAVAAVVFVARRHRWAVVLAIGLCIARAVSAGAAVVQTIGFVGGTAGDASYLLNLLFVIGGQMIPPIVAAALFAWPFLRGGLDAEPEPAYAGDADAEARDGILDAATAAGRTVDWPDWGSQAERR